MVRRSVAPVAVFLALLAGAAVGRATVPPAGGPVAPASEPPATPGSREPGAPALASAPDPLGDASLRPTEIRLDLRTWPALSALLGKNLGSGLWPKLLVAHARAGRVSDALAIARAAIAAGAEPTAIWHATAPLAPGPRAEIVSALRAEGVGLPAEEREWLTVLALAGRAREALAESTDAIAVATSPDAVRALVTEALAGGADLDALRGRAAAEGWDAWRIEAVAASLAKRGAAREAAAWKEASLLRARDEEARGLAAARAQQAATLGSLRERVVTTPDDAGAWVELGGVLREAGDLAGAADAYDRALDLSPYDVDVVRALGAIDPERALRRAEGKWREGATDDERDVLARLYFRTRRGREAAETILSANEIEEEWLRVGIATLAPRRALETLAPRLARAPGNWAFLVGKADALLALGRGREASDELRVAEERDPGDHDLRARWIEADPSGAAARFRTLLEGSPRDESILPYLAEALRREGKSDESGAALRTYGRREGGWLHHAPWVAAHSPEALADLRRLVEAQPQDGWIRLQFARSLEAAGHAAEARREYGEVLRIEEDSAAALVGRARLE